MPEQLVGLKTVSPNKRSLTVRDGNQPMANIFLAAGALNTVKRATIVFGATLVANMKPLLSADLPTATSVFGIIMEDYNPGVAVIAGDKHFMALEGEFNYEYVRATNPIGVLSDVAFDAAREFMMKQGIHLVHVAYGDLYTP